MEEKQFKLQPDQIKTLIEGHGACVTSDHITVQGMKVGYMYRSKLDGSIPEFQGWHFFSGEETQEFVDDANNLAFYETNTIANYDESIIPYLNAPYGTAYALDETGQWVEEKLS